MRVEWTRPNESTMEGLVALGELTNGEVVRVTIVITVYTETQLTVQAVHLVGID